MHQHCTIVSGHSQAFYLNFTFHYDQVALALLTPRVKNKLVFFFLCVTRLIGLFFFFFLSFLSCILIARYVQEGRWGQKGIQSGENKENDRERPPGRGWGAASHDERIVPTGSQKKGQLEERNKERKIRRGSGFVRAKTICMVVTLSVASQRRNLFLG